MASVLIAHFSNAATCTRGQLLSLWSRSQQLLQAHFPRERMETFARQHPITAAFLTAVVICGTLPVGAFLSFALCSAFVLLVLAVIVELLLVGIAFVVLLVAFCFVLAIASALTVPILALWLVYSAQAGAPVQFPPFTTTPATKSSRSAATPENHEDKSE